MIKKTRKKSINVGDTVKKDGVFYLLKETFVADGVRWLRAEVVRKRHRVTISGKTKLVYDVENKYFTEVEWLKIKKNYRYE